MTIESVREPINYIEELLEEDEPNQFESRDSMEEENKRGCDEIMLQFMSDLDSAYDFEFDKEVIKHKDDHIE